MIYGLGELAGVGFGIKGDFNRAGGHVNGARKRCARKRFHSAPMFVPSHRATAAQLPENAADTRESNNDGRYWTRTSDPLLVRQVLYQLS